MCGLPAGWMSPSLRSSRVGTSLSRISSAAATKPGRPRYTAPLPAWRSSTGSQPISSSAPVQTRRSAPRMRAIRAGRAWIWWGSCRPLVAANTSTLSPPSSLANAAHSGSQANTDSADASRLASINASAAISMQRRVTNRMVIAASSELVGAVRAEAHGVLQEDLVVGLRHRVVAHQIEAIAAELAGVVFDHQAVAEAVHAERVDRGADERRIDRGRVELVVAIAGAPTRHELVDALQ